MLSVEILDKLRTLKVPASRVVLRNTFGDIIFVAVMRDERTISMATYADPDFKRLLAEVNLVDTIYDRVDITETPVPRFLPKS